jgi:hypothetical protein
MTGEVACHQPPGITGGPEYHDVQVTLAAHAFTLATPSNEAQPPRNTLVILTPITESASYDQTILDGDQPALASH